MIIFVQGVTTYNTIYSLPVSKQNFVFLFCIQSQSKKLCLLLEETYTKDKNTMINHTVRVNKFYYLMVLENARNISLLMLEVFYGSCLVLFTEFLH